MSVELEQLLGPMAAPSAARLDVATGVDQQGNPVLIAVLSTAVGRIAVWLHPDDADNWAEALTNSARHARGRGGILVAGQMPTGPIPDLTQPGSLPANGIPHA